MKVVFLQNVAQVGYKGQVRDVNDGYARNYLLAKRLAAPATSELLSKLAKAVQQRVVQKQAAGVKVSLAAERLRDARIAISGRASEQGTLYAAVTIPDIIKHVYEQTGVSLKASNFIGFKSIKTVGQHKIQLRFETSLVSMTIIIKSA